MYNAQHWIGETLDSVAKQTFTDWEIVVVDDGSTDLGVEAVESFVSKSHARLQLLRTPNRGVSAARNTGMRESEGHYIALLDADDTWLPTKLEAQVSWLESNPDSIAVGCSYVMQSSDPRIEPQPVAVSWQRERILRWLLLEARGALLPSTILLRANVIASVGYFNEELSTAADLDYAWRLVCTGDVGCVETELVNYRLSPNQMHRDVSLLRRDYGVLLRQAPFATNSSYRRIALVNLDLLDFVRAFRAGRGRVAVSLITRAARRDPAALFQALARRLIAAARS